MDYKAFLIKYAEIGVKGKNRYVFEDALVRQMHFALDPLASFNIRKESGRIFAEALEPFDYDEVVEALSHVFGISAICPILIEENKDFAHIEQVAKSYIRERYDDLNFTFKVMVRRGDKSYPIQSMELAALLGEKLLMEYEELKVDVHHPDVYLTVEIREKVYLYSEEIPGPGGMPVGTGGRAMLLLSGGIDSPVAGYMISKRGVSIEATYFHAPPYTSERARQKVVDLARIISRYTGPIRLHIVNFTDIQMAIYEKCPHDELTIIMRRYMMKIAEHFASKSDCLALVTGESIGQVASQTMQSLFVTNEVCTMPVFRPCIGMDKQDIISTAEKIGTYETSILPYEDCCTIFVAKHPVTKPRLDVIKKSERKLDDCIDDLFRAAIETEEILMVRP